MTPYVRVEPLMGTTVSLHIGDPLRPDRLQALGDDLFAFLHEVDARFSTYRDDSEVSLVERGRLDPGHGSPMLREVLEHSAKLWDDTDGYFDIHATGRLDPSGFVKGWAVQAASDRLVAAGCANHRVNAGGDVRVRGRRLDGAPWRIGVRHPFQPEQVCCVLAGTDLAVATSGVYERGHHVIDPFTGVPAQGLRSVTVVGTDLGIADAYATAAVAMGPAGPAWLARLAGHTTAVVTDAGAFLHSPDLPVVGE